MNRPSYVQCIIRDRGASWCGRSAEDLSGELRFASLEEAVTSLASGSKLYGCPGCIDTATAALVRSRWAGGGK